MELKNFMKKHYNDLALTPDFYQHWSIGIHLELGNNIYQFDENHQINLDLFNKVYKQLSELVPLLFKKTDTVLVVVNTYPQETKKIVYPNFFKRYVKEQKLKYSLHYHEFQWQDDENHVFVQQMSLYCKVTDLKLELLLKTLIHEDFPPLQPRLRKKHCLFAPDVFLINVDTKCIFHVYDDRGCEVINTNLELHEKLVERLNGWEMQAKL